MVKQQSRGLTFELSDLLSLHDHNSHFYSRQCLFFFWGRLLVGFPTLLCRLLREGRQGDGLDWIFGSWVSCQTLTLCDIPEMPLCLTPEWSMAGLSHMFITNKWWNSIPCEQRAKLKLLPVFYFLDIFHNIMLTIGFVNLLFPHCMFWLWLTESHKWN